jgi:A/G-specific adenine glycosylase
LTGPGAGGLVGALGTWAAQNRRDLPWRRTRDPWAILVAETMLCQTQVTRVAARFPAFLERFPTPADCAAAPLRAVVAEWVGLGYNRRAVQLHRAAVLVVERHGGQIPADHDHLRALPGVGPYMARAVLAFAFERDVGVVDTNAARILARAVAGRRLRAGEAQAAADALVPAGQSWTWNQGMLDFGSAVCRTRRPGCDQCPLRAHCAWAVAGRPHPDPAVASAGTTRAQPAFAGSDRQGRGRLVAALAHGALAASDVAAAAGWAADPRRAEGVADGLIADGLVRRASDGSLHLA